jgi:pimeloyl-ACP methyl ester carboxylesterase
MSLEYKRSGLTVKSVSIGDHTIKYLEGGKGEDVVLIHGFGANKDNWMQFAKFITPGYHVIIPDLPGFGESTKLEDAKYNIMAQVERVNALVNQLHLSRFHIAGNSMGGNISANFAVKYPQMVKSLAVLDPSGVRAPVKNEMIKQREKGHNLLLVQNVDDYERLLQFIFVKPIFLPSFMKKILAEQAIKDRPFNEKIFNQTLKDRFILENKLSDIKAYTLIMWGDSDRVIDISSVPIFEKIKNHKTVIIKNCGHTPMLEQPKETANIYLNFLKESK